MCHDLTRIVDCQYREWGNCVRINKYRGVINRWIMIVTHGDNSLLIILEDGSRLQSA